MIIMRNLGDWILFVTQKLNLNILFKLVFIIYVYWFLCLVNYRRETSLFLLFVDDAGSLAELPCSAIAQLGSHSTGITRSSIVLLRFYIMKIVVLFLQKR